MSQQKQAPLPRQEFQEWLENAAVPVLVLQKGKHLGSVFCPLLLIGWPGCLLSTVRALLRQFRRLKQIVAMVTCANQSNHLIPIYYSRQSEN